MKNSWNVFFNAWKNEMNRRGVDLDNLVKTIPIYSSTVKKEYPDVDKAEPFDYKTWCENSKIASQRDKILDIANREKFHIGCSDLETGINSGILRYSDFETGINSGTFCNKYPGHDNTLSVLEEAQGDHEMVLAILTIASCRLIADSDNNSMPFFYLNSFKSFEKDAIECFLQKTGGECVNVWNSSVKNYYPRPSEIFKHLHNDLVEDRSDERQRIFKKQVMEFLINEHVALLSEISIVRYLFTEKKDHHAKDFLREKKEEQNRLAFSTTPDAIKAAQLKAKADKILADLELKCKKHNYDMLTNEELQILLWKYPKAKIAEMYNISDKKIRSRAVRENIVEPDSRFWCEPSGFKNAKFDGTVYLEYAKKNNAYYLALSKKKDDLLEELGLKETSLDLDMD